MRVTYILCPSFYFFFFLSILCPNPNEGVLWDPLILVSEYHVMSYCSYIALQKLHLLKGTMSESLVPGSVQTPTKEWLCLRRFNLTKASERIMEERKIEAHSMIYPHLQWETHLAYWFL